MGQEPLLSWCQATNRVGVPESSRGGDILQFECRGVVRTSLDRGVVLITVVLWGKESKAMKTGRLLISSREETDENDKMLPKGLNDFGWDRKNHEVPDSLFQPVGRYISGS